MVDISKSKSQIPDEPMVPDEIIREYLRIRNDDGIVASKVFYFKHIMSSIRPLLEKQVKDSQLGKIRYSTLVSLMGYSPETTVHSTILLRPNKLIVVYNRAVKDTAEPAIRYLLDENLIRAFDLETIEIDAFNPIDIYDHISARVTSWENTVFDITGGTKIMSATAGALAWERNLSLCYLNGSWDPEKGAAGLREVTQLTIFSNPSRSRGYRYRNDALLSYESGNYVLARERFKESIKLIDDSDFDLLGIQLCDCYSALVDFDREGIIEKIEKLEETLDFGGVRKLYEHRIDFNGHMNALKKFASKDMNLMATSAAFMVLAKLYANHDRFDLAGLLSYRAMERFVEIGLQKIAPDFKLDEPVWSLLTEDESEFRIEYSRLSPSGKAGLPDKVSLISGLSILAIRDESLGKRFRNMKNRDAIFLLMRLANIRNRSYLAHGTNNLSQDDYGSLYQGAMDLAKAVLKDQHAEFELLCSQLEPVELRKLWDDGWRDGSA